MKIVLQNISKRYNQVWIFKNVCLELSSNQVYAITGANGSGKSTFLSIISGYNSPTSGTINYFENNQKIDPEYIYSKIAIAAPYLDVIEEYTFSELIDFHFNFCSILPLESKSSLLLFSGLEKVKNKHIKYYSSGMKQRVKLCLAFFSDKAILLLDEPTVNLDQTSVSWYQEALERLVRDRLVIICSNQAHEYKMANKIIHITDYQV